MIAYLYKKYYFKRRIWDETYGISIKIIQESRTREITNVVSEAI